MKPWRIALRASALRRYLSNFLFHDPPRVFASAFQCSFRFNSYVGLAVAGALHGKPGIAAIGLLMGFLVPLANIAAVAVLARHSEGDWMKSLLGNPLILATAGGVAFSQAGLALPATLDNTLELLARASLAPGPDRGGRGDAPDRPGACARSLLVWRDGEVAAAARHRPEPRPRRRPARRLVR